MSMVGFPLLLIPLAIYNIIVFLMPGVSFADPLLKLMLVSGAEWTVTLSDMLVALGILLLLLEVIKGARPGAKYVTDHLLSLIVFGAAAAEFVLWPKFATSTYFLLAALALADFLSGIALRMRRGAVAASAPAAATKSARKTDTPAAEPRFDPAPAPAPVSEPAPAPAPAPVSEPAPAPAPVPASAPAPAPSVPAAASVAESALQDHPEPTPSQPAAVSTAASPEGSSPGNGPVRPPDTPSR
jgi:hypothetical protein